MEDKLKKKNSNTLSKKEVKNPKNTVCLDDLIDHIMKNDDMSGFTKKQVKSVISKFTDSIRYFLENNQDVYVSGFIRLYIKEARSKTLKNPKTNETINIPAHTKLSAKPCAEFRNACRKPLED